MSPKLDGALAGSSTQRVSATPELGCGSDCGGNISTVPAYVSPLPTRSPPDEGPIEAVVVGATAATKKARVARAGPPTLRLLARTHNGCAPSESGTSATARR